MLGIMRWLRILVGLILIASVGFVVVTRGSVLLSNHLAYPVALALAFTTGLLMVTTGLSATRPARTGWPPRIGRLLGALVGVGLAAALLWLRPFPAAERAIDAMADSGAVVVSDSRTEIRFTPTTSNGSGLVLYPGARVDPRAYAVVAHDIAAAGHPVRILKCAFDVALLCGAPDVPSGTDWVLGGHSLGGVAASRQVDAFDPAGLVFWASYPIDDLSEASLPVASISGTKDGLATPDDITESAADLPPGTVFTAIEGGNHAYFGDYGNQAGDGVATISREEAQAQIVAATLALLALVDERT